jgi:hypothetical protein
MPPIRTSTSRTSTSRTFAPPGRIVPHFELRAPGDSLSANTDRPQPRESVPDTFTCL